MSIGNNIKNLRLSHGLSQLQLAEIAGTTDKAVSSWENNISVPRMGVIEKLSAYFKISKSDIIEDSNLPLSPILFYSGNERIDSVIKTIINADIDDNDLSVIEAVLAKYKSGK